MPIISSANRPPIRPHAARMLTAGADGRERGFGRSGFARFAASSAMGGCVGLDAAGVRSNQSGSFRQWGAEADAAVVVVHVVRNGDDKLAAGAGDFGGEAIGAVGHGVQAVGVSANL